ELVDPGRSPVEYEIERMWQKMEAGAKFFQTQSVFDAEAFSEFIWKKRSTPWKPRLRLLVSSLTI
ncbi:unnamed protein product, partial [marine sediment metagenome]